MQPAPKCMRPALGLAASTGRCLRQYKASNVSVVLKRICWHAMSCTASAICSSVYLFINVRHVQARAGTPGRAPLFARPTQPPPHCQRQPAADGCQAGRSLFLVLEDLIDCHAQSGQEGGIRAGRKLDKVRLQERTGHSCQLGAVRQQPGCLRSVQHPADAMGSARVGGAASASVSAGMSRRAAADVAARGAGPPSGA